MSYRLMEKKPITHFQFAFNTLFNHPVILLPFLIIAFIQTLILEIIYFAPRYPLSVFFAPLILRTHGEIFLHYPYNYLLLTDWFRLAQLPLYILGTSYFFGCAVVIIHLLNGDQEVKIKVVALKALRSYVHLILAAVFSAGFLYGLGFCFDLIVGRAALIRAEAGFDLLIKQVIILGVPYFNLLLAVLVATMFAFVIPIIMIEGKSFFRALGLNFKNLWGSFWYIFTVMLLSMLLYLPLVLLRASVQHLEGFRSSPEMWGALIIVSSLVLLFIQALQCAAVTTFYLYKRETA